jgi:CDP-glycerol glycerophosphotransferase
MKPAPANQGSVSDLTRRFTGVARRVGHQLPAPIQAPLRQLARRVAKRAFAGSSAVTPVLSVIVVARNAESYLADCLHSLQSQTLKRLEVIVVDNGSTDSTAAIAHQIAAQDQRFRILLHQPTPLNAARNAGAALARGRFLAFLDATDTVPRTAYASLINSLRQTGSDFAAGAVRIVVRGRRHRPGWALLTHDLDRPALTLGEFPNAIQDTCATNRVFRTDFWNADVGGFPESVDGDTFAIASATLRAKQFDLLQTVNSVRRIRLPPGKLLPGPPAASELDSRLSWHWATWRLLRDSAQPTVTARWLGGLIDGDLGEFAAHAPRADAQFRERLQQAAQDCLAAVDETAWSQVRIDRKLRLWLVANRQWTDLEKLLQHGALYGSVPKTEVHDGHLYAVAEDLPGAASAPLECRELSENQTALSACVERVAWHHDRLEIHGWAFIRGLDLTSQIPQLTASLIHPATGVAYPCDLVQVHKAAANDWSMFRCQDVAAGGFLIKIDTRSIDRDPGRWQLRLTVAAQGMQRTGPIQAVAPGGTGHLMWGRNLRGLDDRTRVVPKLDPQLGFALHVRPDQIQARMLSTDGAGKASGALQLVAPELGSLVSVAASSPLGRIAGDLSKASADGFQRFELDLPVGLGTGVAWEFKAIDVAEVQHRVSWPIEAEYGLQIDGGPGNAGWQRTITGYCQLLTDWVATEAENVTVAEDELSIDLRLVGLEASDCAGARLAGRVIEVPASRVETVGNGIRLSFPLLTSRWGGPELPLPTDDYRVKLPSGAHLLCSDQLAVQLPDQGLTANHHYRLARDSRGRLVISLGAPLADQERSRLGKQRSATEYQRSTFTPTDSVLFQSYRGEFATDSQVAIHAELRSRRPDLELLWGVVDWSVAVPEGGRALLIESHEWYAALGSSRYLCWNIELDRYFKKRPYQRYLQTFHGYPFKSMGISLWQVQGRPESVIAAECARRSNAWDAIVVPESFCVELYRREYRYTGQVLVTGYPRNDVLVTADTASVRSRVLRQLGIDEDRIVVLYAPTWRDTGATSAWAARFFDGLNLKTLTEQLGDRYAVLLRGHSYNLREGLPHLLGKVWDVSAYPEINDLLLTADVAVLDYSSLRFDWLITGKPVVFYVPDLEDYLRSRKVLFDFPPTAPGPLLATTAEVVEALLDLGSVVSEYAAARELFNKEFNRLHDGHATERVINAFF